jgi:hypothetical protein
MKAFFCDDLQAPWCRSRSGLSSMLGRGHLKGGLSPDKGENPAHMVGPSRCGNNPGPIEPVLARHPATLQASRDGQMPVPMIS